MDDSDIPMFLPPPPKGARERSTNSSNQHVCNANILLVEDDKVVQMMAKAMLEKLGPVVEVANDGYEALDLIASKKFDLVLMDIMMPGLDGYEATRQIRQTDRELPILAFTAKTAQDEIDAALDAGMNDVIAKPVTQARLTQMLRQFIAE